MEERTKLSQPISDFNGYLQLALVGVVAAIAMVWALPPLSFVFGTGSFVVGLLMILVFLAMVLFRRFLFKRLFGASPNESETVLMEYFAQQQGEENEDISNELIENALQLREHTVADCMAPRSEIVHFSAQSPFTQLRQLFTESQLSRIIITENGSLEAVKGYVHVQQMFDEEPQLTKLILPIQKVQSQLPANELLNRFVRTRTNIAVVTGDDGSLVGIVTLENALEQLFGAIEDEHD